MAYAPVRGLTLQLTTAYNDSEVTQAMGDAGLTVGDPLPYSAKWSGSVAADYAFPIGASMEGSLGISYVYQGERHTSWSADPFSPDVVLPSYDTLALRAGLTWSRYSLQLRAHNVTDEYAYTTFYANNFFAGFGAPPVNGLANVLPPRMLTLELSAKF